MKSMKEGEEKRWFNKRRVFSLAAQIALITVSLKLGSLSFAHSHLENYPVSFPFYFILFYFFQFEWTAWCYTWEYFYFQGLWFDPKLPVLMVSLWVFCFPSTSQKHACRFTAVNFLFTSSVCLGPCDELCFPSWVYSYIMTTSYCQLWSNG